LLRICIITFLHLKVEDEPERKLVPRKRRYVAKKTRGDIS